MRTFTMYDEEAANLKTWLEEHHKTCTMWDLENDCYKYLGAIGGSLMYSFAYTSIGQIVKVECVCGEKGDVSDYDSW